MDHGSSNSETMQRPNDSRRPDVSDFIRLWQQSSLADGFTLEWTFDHFERSKETYS